MTKKTFLKKLESKLSSLSEEKIANIINKYNDIIDEEIKSGKLEKDVVDSLGDIDMISKIYLNDKEEAKEEHENEDNIRDEEQSVKDDAWTTDRVIGSVLNYVEDVFSKIDADLAKRILLLLFFIAIGIAALALVHLPFLIIEFIGQGTFKIIFSDLHFYKVVTTFWTLSLGICYAIVAIWLILLFIKQIVRRFSFKTLCDDITSSFKEGEGTHRTTDADYRKTANQYETKYKRQEATNYHSSDVTTNVFDVIYVVLKVFIIILTIPLIIIETLLFIALFFTVSLIISGVTLYGPGLIILGLIFLIASILDLVYRALSKGGIK